MSLNLALYYTACSRLLAIKECFPPETARSLARWRSLNAKRVTWESVSTTASLILKLNVNIAPIAVGRWWRHVADDVSDELVVLFYLI